MLLGRLISLIKIIIFFLFLVFFTVFVSNNSNFVRLNLSPFEYVLEIRVFLLILISFAFGVIMTALFNYICNMLNFKTFFYVRKTKVLEKELKNMKNKYKKLELKNEATK